MTGVLLPRSFFEQGALIVARELLGMVLVHEGTHGVRAGRIVETEAYLGSEDLASHASKGLTSRTEAMFGPAGHAYVYLIYGIHHCMNAVTGPRGEASAVLLRGLEPLWKPAPRERTDGPGRLTRALSICREQGGFDLCSVDSSLRMEQGQRVRRRMIKRGPRVGVDYAGAWAKKPYRFYVRDHPCVSAPRD